MKMIQIQTEDKSASRWFKELIDKHRLTKDNQVHSAMVLWEYGGKIYNAKLNCRETELREFKNCIDRHIMKEMIQENIQELIEEQQ